MISDIPAPPGSLHCKGGCTWNGFWVPILSFYCALLLTNFHEWHSTCQVSCSIDPLVLEITFFHQKCESVSSICLQSMGNLLTVWRMHCSYFLVCHFSLLQWREKKKVIVLFNFRVETWYIFMLSYNYLCAILVLHSKIPSICLALIIISALWMKSQQSNSLSLNLLIK